MNEVNANFHQSTRDREESLICEALVDEIINAKRWGAVVAAWQALLAVRRMAEALREDRRAAEGGSLEPTKAA